MLSIIRKLSLLLLIAAVLCFLAVSPVLAAPANPDSITLHTIKAFQNIFELNDVLFVASYDVEYASEPSEPASDTFLLAVYDTDGTTLIQSRPLNYYQYNVHSVYFTATQATSLTWGSEYRVRVTGSPAHFSPLTEDTNIDTTTLSSSAWIEGTMTESRELLRLHCLDLAADLEAAWSLVLIVVTPDGQVLNSTGRNTFLDAVPGLDVAVPDLFQLASGTITTTKQTRTAALEQELTIANQLGTTIKAAFDGIGNYINVSGEMVAGMWIALFALVVASIIFLNSGNTTAAMILVIPVVLLGVAVGAVPMALLFTASTVLVVFTAYHIWLRGM